MYNDQDLFPFGTYKGQKMSNVPASYLLWLKSEIDKIAPNKRSVNQKQVLEYVNDNEDVLIKERQKDQQDVHRN